MDFSDRYFGALKVLEKNARKETVGWGFDEWYQNGIDWYLAREVLYLVVMWNDPGETGIDVLKYTDCQLASMAREYVETMDDFTRLWNFDETKLEVLKEFQYGLRSAWPQVEGKTDNGEKGDV